MPRLSRKSSLLFGALLLGHANGAFAQAGSSKAAAETLFNEGRRLLDEGKFAEACPKLADSQRLDPGVGTLLNLGRCYKLAGQTASAWSTFKEAAAAARSAGQLDREELARGEATALEPTLSRIVIVAKAEPGLEILVNGAAVPSSLWGIATPVDPGEVSVRAKAPGKRTWESAVKLAGIDPLRIEIPVLQAEAAPAVTKVSSGSPPTDAGPATGSTQRITGLVLGGVGLVGIGVGSYFGLAAKSTYDDSAPHCRSDSNVCSADGESVRNDAYSQATISTIAFAAGGAALLTGTILWLTAPSAKAAASRAPALAIGASPRSALVSISSAW